MRSRTCAQPYIRERDLPRLLGLWPQDVAALRGSDLDGLIARLERAIRAERRRALHRDWTYDLSRHWALIRARDAELQALQRYRRQEALSRLTPRVAPADARV
ncbi:MAG: hypothetical protein U1E49_00020 [Hyphomicrobiaceae bacterium]